MNMPRRIHTPLVWAMLLSLSLSSCQTLPRWQPPMDEEPAPIVEDGTAIASDGPQIEQIPSDAKIASTAETTPHVCVEPIPFEGNPIPLVNASPWAPPGIAGPWPRDEYLEDGGDRDIQVNLGPRGEVQGLEMEDTVAVYDSKSGCTKITPSNKVCLYAPRFGAVRHVTSVVENLQNDQLVAVRQPLQPVLHQDDQVATTAVQPERPEGEIGTRQPSIERSGEGAHPAISLQPIRAVENNFALYENFLVIRRGIFEESEKAHLLIAVQNAITWTHDQAVQVLFNGRAAVDVTGDQRAQATFKIDEPDCPCLRVIKVASTKTARPGDIVDFTIRFDNLGDARIEHLTLIDNLTTRLEYVPQTSQSSRPAEFTTQVNEGGSLVLRWDFTDPLPVGEGGLVRFHCRVR